MTTVIIEPRYNGPSGSGNGGWTSGLIAAHLDGPAVVTLRVPPPLSTPLSIRSDAGRCSAYAPDGTLVANAAGTELAPEPIPPVTYPEAEAIAAAYPGFTAHPFPGCFVCGPERAEGDGLRLFTGRRDGGDTATPWTVPADVSPAMVWASLDCPGGWSIGLEARPYVLGRIAAHVDAVPAAGERCVIMGRLLATEGRKAEVAATLYGSAGGPLAWARATWIAI